VVAIVGQAFKRSQLVTDVFVILNLARVPH